MSIKFLGDGKQQLSFFINQIVEKIIEKNICNQKKASIDILTQEKYYVKRFLDIVLFNTKKILCQAFFRHSIITLKVGVLVQKNNKNLDGKLIFLLKQKKDIRKFLHHH